MRGKMKGVTLFADWDPRPDFKLGPKDIEGKQTYLGSRVWRNPRMEIVEYDIPKPGPSEVLLEVKACGICGSPDSRDSRVSSGMRCRESS
jgi:hypothetical protein